MDATPQTQTGANPQAPARTGPTPRTLTKFERVFLTSLVLCCILFSIVGVVNFFRGVTSIPMINPIMGATHFSKPEEIGAVLDRRFWIEVSNHPLIVLGGTDAASQRVWNGFKEVATREFHIQFQNVVENKLNQLNLKSLKPKQHALVLVDSTPEKLSEIQKRWPKALLFFSMPLPITKYELMESKINCKNSKFSCWEFAADRQSHEQLFSSHTRKVSATKWTAVVMQLERYPNTNLVFVHPPAK